jgi:uncharacterized protein
MSKKIFVNLPVKDLNRSIKFFTKLGFKFNPQFTDERATCMVIGDDILIMLLVEDFFKTLALKAISDSAKNIEVIVTLSADSREEVDNLTSTAVRAGAKSSGEINDQGWMYGRGFQDLDGHLWEIIYMNSNALENNKNN